jgi:hypothetical protein
MLPHVQLVTDLGKKLLKSVQSVIDINLE